MIFQFRLQIIVGMIIGMFSYFMLRTRVLLELIYDKVPETAGITIFGVGIVAAMTGLLSREIVGEVTSRFSSITKKDQEDGI